MINFFTEENRKEFVESIKTGKAQRNLILEQGMSWEEAFNYAYLDVSRTPLKGIGESLNCSTEVARKECIDKLVREKERLLKVTDQEQFDEIHKECCEMIDEHYKQHGYNEFYVGKAQKWINMALKYICIYWRGEEKDLEKIAEYCHVPLDRYIADPIVNKLNVDLPQYEGFKMPQKRPFSAENSNYSWSKITDYREYLKCQCDIKNALGKNKAALLWEFEQWLDEKNKKVAK